MEYTEQQKKEYHAMRRQRYKDQQELRTYLKGGFEMSSEDKKDLRHAGYTKGGGVFGGASKNKSRIRKIVRDNSAVKAALEIPAFFGTKKSIDQFTKAK